MYVNRKQINDFKNQKRDFAVTSGKRSNTEKLKIVKTKMKYKSQLSLDYYLQSKHYYNMYACILSCTHHIYQ